ncbi:MAG: FecR family protein [Tannerella sp.]|jgi:ferric-dicitrate binding protein FerR (iron transport regulator)|nr:FecR family protein [Tannerella sp.]
MDKELLQRYIEGNVSREETEAVVDWLDEDKANVRELIALHKLYDISLFNKPVLESETIFIKNKLVKKYRKIVYELLKIAAIFLIFAAVSQLFLHKPEKNMNHEIAYQTLFIPPGQRAELMLPDSTKVWLNAKTRLVYPVSFGEGDRMVILDGEAYFDVRPNENKPFIVKTEMMDINVLGTEFNIMAYSGLNTTRVALLKGSVDIKALKNDSSGGTINHIMKINEQATLHNGKLTVSQITDFDYFKWKEGLLCFNNEPVGSMIAKLQLYFDIKINVEKKDLLKYKYTGKFRTKDGVEQVLKVLQLEHKFTYTKDNELNVITIK